jgi:exopolysaccharide biosynthesis WecB/TagA/CpsF family protein
MIDELKEQLRPFTSLDEASEFIRNNSGLYISMNLQAIVDEQLKGLLKQANVYAYADGIGAQFFWQRKFNIRAPKIPGCELWLQVLKDEPKKCNIAIIGASAESNVITVSKLKAEYPQHNVCFAVDGFSLNEALLLTELNALELDYIFIALGQPRQELLGFKLLEQNQEVKVLGLGGAFDVYAGLVHRAPDIFVHLWMEWLYRILMQPKRSGKLALAIYKYLVVLFIK